MQNIRTDLALEAHELSKQKAKNSECIEGVEAEVEEYGSISVTKVRILNNKGSKALGKAVGSYITIEAPNLKYSINDYERVCSIIADGVRNLTEIEDNSLILVVGLGNREITPDALGTKVISNLMITHHIKDSVPVFKDLNDVCAVVPGVLGTTGMETADIICAVTEKLKPNLVIAVDALAAADIRRVNTTIQISDTGIQPGAGVGNNRDGLNEKTLGVKVIAIGVPTVIDASTISNIDIPKELAPLMVTTKDIDLVIERMSKTVANGINLALHKNLSLKDIENFVG